VPNKATVEARAACAALVDDPEYQTSLRQRLVTGTLAPAVETMLWYYAKGKPKETVAVTSDAELLERLEAGRRRVRDAR
jgi:hypothetical protein